MPRVRRLPEAVELTVHREGEVERRSFPRGLDATQGEVADALGLVPGQPDQVLVRWGPTQVLILVGGTPIPMTLDDPELVMAQGGERVVFTLSPVLQTLARSDKAFLSYLSERDEVLRGGIVKASLPFVVSAFLALLTVIVALETAPAAPDPSHQEDQAEDYFVQVVLPSLEEAPPPAATEPEPKEGSKPEAVQVDAREERLSESRGAASDRPSEPPPSRSDPFAEPELLGGIGLIQTKGPRESDHSAARPAGGLGEEDALVGEGGPGGLGHEGPTGPRKGTGGRGDVRRGGDPLGGGQGGAADREPVRWSDAMLTDAGLAERISRAAAKRRDAMATPPDCLGAHLQGVTVEVRFHSDGTRQPSAVGGPLSLEQWRSFPRLFQSGQVSSCGGTR